MKKFTTILILWLLSATITLAQSIKDYYIPDSAFNKATYYVNDPSGNVTGFTRLIYYITKGKGFDIIDYKFFNGDRVATETTTIQFFGNQVQMIKSITTNPLETNKKRIYNPAKIILKMPLNGKPVTWILIEGSGQKDIKTASLLTLNINGTEKKAIKVKTVVSGQGKAYTNEYYVIGIGLWETETVGNGSKNTLYQFKELLNEDGTKHLMAPELGNNSNSDSTNQSTPQIDMNPKQIMTLENGIPLCTDSKSEIAKYLDSQGFSFVNSNNARLNFKKIMSEKEYYFSIQFENSTVDGIEWTENINNAQEYVSKLEKDLRFILNKTVEIQGREFREFRDTSRNLSIVLEYNDYNYAFFLIKVKNLNKKTDDKVISILSDPRKMDVREGKRIFTTLSHEQIFQYYKKLGAERVSDNQFKLKCISISISKSGKLNVIDLSWECGY